MNGDASASFALAQVHRPLTLFAQALAGQALALRASERHAPFGRRRVTATTPAAIELPAETAAFATHAENLRALRVALLRQIVALPFADARLPRHPRPVLLRRVFETLEGARVDAILHQRFPGARRDLEHLRAQALTRRAAAGPQRPAAVLLDALWRHALGVPRATLERERPHALLGAVLDAAQWRDSRRAALEICRLLEPGRTSLRIQSGWDTAAMPDPASNEPAEPGASPPGAIDAPRDGGERDDEADGATAWSSGPAGGADDIRRSRSAQVNASAPEGVGTFHDEWDMHSRRYLPAWCRVRELALHGTDVRFAQAARLQHADAAREIRRLMSAWRPELRQRTRHERDGDEVDLDSLVDAIADRRAGRLGDGRVFVSHRHLRRDVSAVFLVDISGSTGFAIPADEPASPALPDNDPFLYGGQGWLEAPSKPRRRVIDIAKESLCLMADALHAIGDRHAIYGFSGQGRHDVEFHVAKEFDEPWSTRSAAALGAMEPRGSTRTGAAIRHALTRLARENARTRLLIVVTDGYPQDRDYGPEPDIAEYGVQDTARALREAEQAGVSAFCISIDRAAHDYLRRMCRDDRYLVIDDVAALPTRLGKVYRALSMR